MTKRRKKGSEVPQPMASPAPPESGLSEEDLEDLQADIGRHLDAATAWHKAMDAKQRAKDLEEYDRTVGRQLRWLRNPLDTSDLVL